MVAVAFSCLNVISSTVFRLISFQPGGNIQTLFFFFFLNFLPLFFNYLPLLPNFLGHAAFLFRDVPRSTRNTFTLVPARRQTSSESLIHGPIPRQLTSACLHCHLSSSIRIV